MTGIRMGVVFPQTEFGNEWSAVRDYAQAVEGLGFSHIVAYDHVLGANPERPGGWTGPYTYQSSFLEPFVLFSYIAGITHNVGLTTSIIILPQRQTALVAKQAACLDVISGGRLRLGFGLGWNEVEYIGLNEDFHTRGRRFEEQIDVMRQLWTQPLVIFSGRWHTMPDAGINPLPMQQPIPVWFGGHSEPVLRRTARLADGWMPIYRKPEDARPALDHLRELLMESGRDPAQFGVEARIPYGSGDPKAWQELVTGWQAVGATHFSVNTMGSDFNTPTQHLRALERFAAALGIG